MENLIDYTYFKGPTALPQMSQDYVRVGLDSLISECQAYLLDQIFTDCGKSVEYLLKSKRSIIIPQATGFINNDVDIFHASNINYVTSDFLEGEFRTGENSLSLIKDLNIDSEVSLLNLINNTKYVSSSDSVVKIGLHVFKGGQDVGYVYYYKDGIRDMIHMEQPQAFGFAPSDVISDVFDMTVDYLLYETTNIKIEIEQDQTVYISGFNIGNYFVSFYNFERLREKFLSYIREVLTNFVYCTYLYDVEVKVTQSGTAKGESENSKRVSPIQKHVTRWNINVDFLRDEAHNIFKNIFTYRYKNILEFNKCTFCESTCDCSRKKNILYNYKNSLGL